MCALREARAVEKTIPGLLTRHSVASVQREVLAQLDIATVDAADLPPRGQKLRGFIKRADEVAAALPDEITLVAKASAAIDKASRDGGSTGLAFAARAELEETFGPFELRGAHLVGHTLARGESVSAHLDARGKCEGLRMSFPKPIPELWTPEAFVRLALGPRAKLRVAPQGDGEIVWKEGKIPVTATWKNGAVMSISVGAFGAGM